MPIRPAPSASHVAGSDPGLRHLAAETELVRAGGRQRLRVLGLFAPDAHVLFNSVSEPTQPHATQGNPRRPTNQTTGFGSKTTTSFGRLGSSLTPWDRTPFESGPNQKATSWRPLNLKARLDFFLVPGGFRSEKELWKEAPATGGSHKFEAGAEVAESLPPLRGHTHAGEGCSGVCGKFGVEYFRFLGSH